MSLRWGYDFTIILILVACNVLLGGIIFFLHQRCLFYVLQRKNNQLISISTEAVTKKNVLVSEKKISVSTQMSSVPQSLEMYAKNVEKNITTIIPKHKKSIASNDTALTQGGVAADCSLVANAPIAIKKRSTHVLKRRRKRSRYIQQDKDGALEISWPINNELFWVSSYFGPRNHGFHHGIDMAAVRGTPVKAAASGVVEYAGWASGYGNLITLTHGKKYKTRYAHLHKILVKPGQHVRVSQIIGEVGDTGYTIARGTDASHLHFEVCKLGKQVNPLQYLP